MYVPENEILKQGEPAQGMFFVSNGDCIISVKDQSGKDHNLLRLLVQGDHFGEISSIFKCKTSATVVSRNYNIMAMISVDRFRELTIDFP
jgi:CRP-like cAMP-binding protein